MNDQEIRSHYPHVVKLAYRMLGSIAEAEEIAQEAFLRWHESDGPSGRPLRSWLTKTATRLCVDRLRSAEWTKKSYIGEELPEPLVSDSPSGGRELDETLSMALLTTLQRLNATERAVFLLHDVFSYSFSEVADILDLRSDHCRQLAVRARKHLALERVRTDASVEDIERLTDAFFEAIESGETLKLRSFLGEDVVFRSDGGGKVAAALKPIRGRDAVSKFLEGIFIKAQPRPVLHRTRIWFNGAPGIVITDEEGRAATAIHFLIHDDCIRGIYAQRNPDKLIGIEASLR